ncbi:hypothetical protein [Bacillus aerius]|uniref:hypothetical protein n=1 Tax=Bacillus aerius TaxID=293388 RepID=UPI00247E4730|nr:hypothetical protein [Bacillus aerius]MDH6597754.1 hypothetical protein [Bacillus aerius]
MIHWINHNKEWIFSGIGVVILSGIGKLIFDRRADSTDKGSTYIQNSGDNSTNIQGNNVNCHTSQKKEKKNAKQQ